MLKALILYFSATGNTEKVAKAIRKSMRNAGVEPVVKNVKEAEGVDLYDYDLVCLGAPSYEWLPPRPVQEFLRKKLSEYRKLGYVKLCAPKVPGKYALVFCTYSGPHTGISEAIPAGKYMRQFFEHFGFDVRGEWYIVGEFHGFEEYSTKGKLGDIRGRPNAQDLAKVESDTVELVRSILSEQ